MRVKDPKIAWLLLYVFVNIVATIIMLTTGQLIGDAAGNRVYNTDILLLASFLVVFSYIFFLVGVYGGICKCHIKKINFGVSEDALYSKIGIFLIVFQILFMLFNLSSGVNVAGSNNLKVGGFSSIFWALMPVDALFLIYYGVARDNKYFRINLLIYLVSNVSRGWAGVFLIVAFMEWCWAYRNQRIKFKYILPLFVVFLLFYPILNAIKFYIRTNPNEFSLIGFLDVFDSNFGNISYVDSVYLGVLHVVERIQTVSILAMVIQLKDFLYIGYLNGEFSPFWWEGLHGIVFDRLLGNSNNIPFSVAFTKYGSFNWDFEIGNWNTNTAYASWFFVTPYLIPLYLFYSFLLCFVSYVLIKKISSSISALDLLWMSWLLYLLPPWFGTFVQFIYALFIFLVLKSIFSLILLKKELN